MLSIEELDELLNRIEKKVISANRTGTLDELLEKLDLREYCENKKTYETFKSGKIVVIGQSEINKEQLLQVIKKLKIDEKRFEFNLEYNDAIKYPYEKLRFQPKYRVIMFGPTPHSTTGTVHNESVIAELENQTGYPRVVRLQSNETLKITKTSFKKALKELIEQNYI